MDFEPWWLIIVPVLFALGWLAARFDFRQMLSETRALPDSYFKGLNFLLNEQPDRAIDAFIEVAKLDPETTELHFALGNLFLRRGEIERAIRVHQSLLARQDLPHAERENAQLALAHDFLRAGMLDRAEQGFGGLIGGPHASEALKNLIRIHESEHDWQRAIQAVERLQEHSPSAVPQLVHYHCELAQAAAAGQPADLAAAAASLRLAEEALRQSNATAAAFTRVRLMHAQIAALRAQPGEQLRELQAVLEQAPEFAGLVASDLLAAASASDQQASAISLLRAHYEKYPSLDLFSAILRALCAAAPAQEAADFALQAMRTNPSLLGLERVLHAGVNIAPATPEGLDGGLLQSIIKAQSLRLDRYVCDQCGFEAKRFYWQCPGCHSWESYRPLRLEELRS